MRVSVIGFTSSSVADVSDKSRWSDSTMPQQGLVPSGLAAHVECAPHAGDDGVLPVVRRSPVVEEVLVPAPAFDGASWSGSPHECGWPSVTAEYCPSGAVAWTLQSLKLHGRWSCLLVRRTHEWGTAGV